MNEAESTTEQTTTPGRLSELEWLGVFVVWPVAALTFIVLVAVGLWWLTQESGVGD